MALAKHQDENRYFAIEPINFCTSRLNHLDDEDNSYRIASLYEALVSKGKCAKQKASITFNSTLAIHIGS